MLDGVLTLLDDLYRSGERQVELQPLVTQCLRAAVAAIGVPQFLVLLPLNLGQSAAATQRPWLLAVLRGAVPRGSPLGYVADTLLPLATGLKHAADAAKAANSQLEATQYHALWLQAWGLLPGFCTAASSVPQAFPRLARDLGTVLNSEPELRPTICAALGRLIETSCTLASAPPGGAETVAANRAAVGPFAKNFLPILFNLFTTSAIDHRSFLLDAVRTWVTVADTALLANLFASIVRKLVDTAGTADPAVRHSMLDLALALAPALDTASLSLLYRTLVPFLVVRRQYHAVLKKSGASSCVWRG